MAFCFRVQIIWISSSGIQLLFALHVCQINFMFKVHVIYHKEKQNLCYEKFCLKVGSQYTMGQRFVLYRKLVSSIAICEQGGVTLYVNDETNKTLE